MAIHDNYQWPLTLVKRITFEDLVDGEGVPVHLLPPGAIVIGGTVSVITPWDSQTTAVLDVGDEDDDDRYTASAINLKAAAGTTTALTLSGYRHAAPTELLLELTETGDAATAGEAVITLTLVMEGRDTEWVS